MGRGIEELLGILDSGKRIYRVDESVITREEFQAQALIHQLVFGEKGLADTLGQTWDMIHDPRFEAIENAFIRERQARFGGDATTGIQRQQADGTFETTVDDLNQYAEIIGEGRYFHSVLRSMAYQKAIYALFPDRAFKFTRGDYQPGLTLFNQLDANDQAKVGVLAATYTEFMPKNLCKQSDESLWGIIKQECPNYFSRTGVVNQVGKDLFKILRLDLVGLIDDYAEVAKIQEWVLLDQEGTLVEQKHVDAEVPRVWAEVEILERALSFRASLRVTAAQVLKATGLEGMIEEMDIDLTDLERDHLLKLLYTSDYPDNIPQLMGTITSYLAGLRFQGPDAKLREADQCRALSCSAKAYIAKLKSGEEKPITRDNEATEDLQMTEEELIAEQIMLNPIKQMLFIRMTNAERRKLAIDGRLKLLAEQLGHGDDDAVYSDIGDWTYYSEALGKVIGILKPVFETSTFVVDEEIAADLLEKAEALDPTRKVQITEVDQSLPTPTPSPAPLPVEEALSN
jgi:hypothetical protein